MAAAGRGELGGGGIALPLAVEGVLQHRNHQRAVQRGGEDMREAGVVLDLERAGPVDRERGRGDPVQPVDMALERGGAVIAPRRVEADGDRLGARGGRRHGGLSEQELAGAAGQVPDLRAEGQRRGVLVGDRQRRRGGNAGNGRREDRAGRESHEQQEKTHAANPDAPVAGGIEEDGCCHCVSRKDPGGAGGAARSIWYLGVRAGNQRQ